MSSSTISTHPVATVSSWAPIAGEQLERRLEELLHQDRFAPPARFVATERINDASLHARAELDPEGFWAEQARELHWDEPFTTVLDDSNPPFYRWFTDGKLNGDGRARTESRGRPSRAGVGAIDPSPPRRAHRLMAGSNAKQGDRARAHGLVARAL